jgi:glutathione synthase/RimK-type ligase-like ATP-grasp enzyme
LKSIPGEKMLAIMNCVVQACENLKIPYTFLDENQNLVRVDFKKPYYFINFTSPFGRHDIVRICRDKEFTYRIVKDVIRTPQTTGYLDPLCREDHRKYAKFKTNAEIAEAIQGEYSLPVIVKRNQGTRGRNVFLCRTPAEIPAALEQIFNPNTKMYDYVAIAQEYVPIYREFRVILFYGEILLIYQKKTEGATFTGNLSPLHWENSRAEMITEPSLIQNIHDFVTPLNNVLELQFSGLDVVQDHAGNWWLIEINSQPDFELFIRDNGEAPVIEIYKKMLTRLKLTAV